MTGSIRKVCRATAAIVFFLTASLAWSQSTATGTVVGQVTDPSNAVVVGATVTLTDSTTGKSQTTTTNDAGRYIFSNVALGTYDVTIAKEGFAQTRVAQQSVDVGATTTINVAMKLGAATETVTVEATGAQLQTMNATVGTTIGFQNLQELPNLGRDASSLVELQPGISLNGSVAGAVRDQNTFQLDGGNNTNDMDGTMNTYTSSFASGFAGSAGGPTGVMPTPVESIEEFKVNVTGQTTDFNGSAGAQVQMATRRGGQSWHGSAYEFYFGSNFAANTWINNHVPLRNGTGQVISPTTPLASNHYNRFGASAGGPVGPKFLGGKTYLFLNYEGRRFPQNTQQDKLVPSPLLRAGVIQLQDGSGVWRPYNLNTTPVTVNGVTYAPAQCGGTTCDPRTTFPAGFGPGLNPLVSQIWNKYMPAGNDFTAGDAHNTIGYLTGLKLPQSDNIGIARLDHDFGEKWHFMGSFRYYELAKATADQFDVSGLLSGGSFGSAVSTSNRPQYPWLYVAQMTTAITPTLSNNFNYSFLRNWWQWGTRGGVNQFSNLGGALEIGGESTNALIPYNINTQSTRNRFWDGHDQTFRDDLTLIHGNHLFSFGGSVQHNWDAHGRNDNGGGIDAFNVYQIGGSSGSVGASTGVVAPSAPTADSTGAACVSGCVPSSSSAPFLQLYEEVLGIVSQAQSMYSRQLPNLSLLPLGTPVVAHVKTDYYSGYFGDSWHFKPSITFTYGLSYLLQMPPFEQDGKQVMLVNQSDEPVYAAAYLKDKQNSALNPTCTGTIDTPTYSCSIYNPILGFAALPNVAGGTRKYPYDVFYGGFSPHVAVAWNPTFDSGILGKLAGGNKSVLRAGYSQIYGRLNGVANILTPLLTPSLLQAVQCVGITSAGQCLGPGGATGTTAFRIGVDGNTAPLGPAPTALLPQPYIPGVAPFLTAPVGDALGLDPSFRPNRVDSIDVTIQRQLSNKAFVELGYIGRFVNHELVDVDINAVPYMTTLGGQSYAQAFGAVYKAVCGLGATCANNNMTVDGSGRLQLYTGPTQPFFEAALGGPTSNFCKAFASCTQAVFSARTAADGSYSLSQFSNMTKSAAYSLWSTLSNQSSWVLGRTIPASQNPGGCVGSPLACTQTAAVGQSLSNGTSNYHAGFVSFTLRDWHGITGTSNFTWSHALGLGATTQSTSLYTVVDPWNIERSMYGEQFFDTKFLFNQGVTYHPPFFKSQGGLIGKALGGWGLSPLFFASSGLPVEVSVNGNCQSFGESNCDDSTNENAVLIGPRPAMTTNYGVTSTGAAGANGNINNSCIVNGAVTCGGVGLNAYSNPQAVYNSFRRMVLGIDTAGGGGGRIRGFPRWNLDLQVTKSTKFTERFSTMAYFTFTNVLNHFQPADPSTNIDSAGNFGRITDSAFNSGVVPTGQRQMEFGLKINW